MDAILIAAGLFGGTCSDEVRGFDFSCFRSIVGSDLWIEPFLLVIMVTVVAQTAGIMLGFPLALARISKSALVRAPATFYLWLFRGTPLLLQILFIYDGTAELTGNSPLLYPITRNAVVAGILALTLNEAAYMAEILRSGLQAVDAGQLDAARALGMSQAQLTRRIVIPQALRIVVPPTTNEYINMSKNTSLLVIISVHELMQQAANYYSANFRYFEALSVAAIYYLVVTTILTQVQKRIEDRFGERQDRDGLAQPGFLKRAFMGAQR